MGESIWGSGERNTLRRMDMNARIKERLDRAVADNAWIEAHPTISVQHLRLEVPYHYPILIQAGLKKIKVNPPFRFSRRGSQINRLVIQTRRVVCTITESIAVCLTLQKF